MGFFSAIGDFFTGKDARSQTEQTERSTSVSNPWAAAVPSLTSYLDKVGTTFASTPQISPYEQQGYDMLKSTAGSGGVDYAIDQNKATASGQYLTPDTNPYLADIAKRAAGGAMQAINSTFGGQGRSGSGLHAKFAGEGVGDAITDLYGQQYSQERALQEAAVGRAAGLDAARYLPASAMIEAGQGISARPFDLLNAQGGILANIAGLGGTTTNDGTMNSRTKGNAEKTGALEKMGNNLLFGK